MAADPPVAQLKLEALLAEVVVDYDKLEPRVNAVVDALNDYFSRVPEKKVTTSSINGFLKDLNVPKEKAILKFKRPESLVLVGSYALRTVAKPAQCIDLALRIPKACFHEKDFLNHRYHAKRALYLSRIYKHLRFSSIITRVEWGFLRDDARKPILLLYSGPGANDSESEICFRILPTIAKDTFDNNKLIPTRNNVRDAKSKEGMAEATPNYNASILEDMFMEDYVKYEKDLLSEFSGLRDAILLAKVWLRRRRFDDSPDNFDGFLFSILLCHLCTPAGGRRIAKSMTCLQMFYILMDSIGHDLLKKKVTLHLEGCMSFANSKKMQELSAHDNVAVWDPCEYYNLAWRVSKCAAEEIQDSAMQTHESIKIFTKDNGFDESFLASVDFAAKFDIHVRLSSVMGLDHPDLTFLDMEQWRMFERKTRDVLHKALGKRARLVRVLSRKLSSVWHPKKSNAAARNTPLSIGIILNSFEDAFRKIDIGPNADDKKEAAVFRAFWGRKAELRRLKDGRICEAVVWDCENTRRHLIIKDIIEYVILQHLSIESSQVLVVCDQLDFALLDHGKDPTSVLPKLFNELENLSKGLRGLDTLPLKISSVQPLDAAFRHTAVFPPAPHPLACQRQSLPAGNITACLKPLEVMIQLEGSGRWPNDNDAIEKTKLAFCLRIADSMNKKWGLSFVASEDDVDILVNGFAFRLKVFYEKDASLLKALENSSTGKILRPSKDLLLRSMHSSMLHGLHGIYPAYGPTVRLCKRWIGAHLFSGVLAEEAVELIVAHLFLRPHPMAPPSSRITGFLRFLRLLGTYDWSLSPLIVDINHSFTGKDLEDIMAHFDLMRSQPEDSELSGQGGPAMFIATSYDRDCATWTSLSPSKVEMKRLVAYAKSSLHLLCKNINGEDNRWQSLFRTPLRNYDALLKLESRSLPHPGYMLFPAQTDAKALFIASEAPERQLALIPNSFLRDGPQAAMEGLLVGFDPQEEFLNELKVKFGDCLSMWFDAFGSDVIAITVAKQLPSNKCVGEKRKRDQTDFNVELKALMSDIFRLGDGFVHSVHLLSKS